MHHIKMSFFKNKISFFVEIEKEEQLKLYVSFYVNLGFLLLVIFKSCLHDRGGYGAATLRSWVRIRSPVQ